MTRWRGILELNETVEAETEEEAQTKFQAIAPGHEWILWEEPARSAGPSGARGP
jgi:hypothetical protein